MSHTIAACSSGALPCAIGIVRLSGDDAGRILNALFRPRGSSSITDKQTCHLHYGKLLSPSGETVDLCLAAFYRAPRSYTGEDMAEIFCHGSAAVVESTLRHAFSQGARPAQPGEFTRRAFLNGKMGLVEAEAVADLLDAQSEREALNAAAQLDGAIGRPLRDLRAELTGLTAHFYAVCDYPDEDIDPFEYQNAQAVLLRAEQSLARLADGFERGSLLKSGFPVAVVGRPNAGKSSLFNALAGSERAIVTAEAGTTRDVLEQPIALSGGRVLLMDTAGIRTPEGEAERIGVERALRAAQQARAALWVFDGSQLLPVEPEELPQALRGKPCAAVVNKSDLPPAFDPATLAPRFDALFTLSAKTGEGLDALCEWLSGLIPPAAEILVTSPRQAALLRQALESVRAALASAQSGMTADAFLLDVEQAIRLLGEVTGEDVSADIIHEIFSRFCVGK